MDIQNIYSRHAEDVEALQTWCTQMYDTKFAKYFIIQENLYKRMNSSTTPITDAELESILMDIPLQLISVSEQLNSVKLEQELLKLKIKQAEMNCKEARDKVLLSSIKNIILEDKLLCSAYDCIISRVDRQISFSRELIMSAKKIWDSRRATIATNPVQSKNYTLDNLPDYGEGTPQTYVK